MQLLDRPTTDSPAADHVNAVIEADLVDLGPAGRIGRVLVSGPVDTDGAVRLAEGLDRLVAAGVDRIVVDATDARLEALDAFRALARARRRLEVRGGTMVLDGLRPAAEGVMEATARLDAA
ncbi:MAG: hypothetical protein ACOYOP_14845 [Microthrixaceae bacterium]